MEWLKELLKKSGIDESKIDGIISDISKEVPKYLMPKDKYNELAESKKKLETDIKTRDTQLEELKKTAGTSEDLKKQIETLQTENKTAKEKYENELKDLTLANAIKMAISGKVHDESIVSGLLDKTKLVVDGDKVLGLDDQLKVLKESKAFLFSEDTNPGGTGGKGNQTRQTGAKDDTEGAFGKRLAETAASENKAVQESTKHYF